ncbi:hypothetical protein UFOVP129_78 [uncultured Caudovirales phage]|uniref:Uncharacterized protein n=1 Tax=uncultured Caudovirales phage TaxID=2100421 RepID=A0A6J5L9U9_9CAUD|nr:hypothetical protein UFOVP129_78 [uncultured Caudovirales phage]
MKRKKDFTVKGTKLPVIPKGTMSATNDATHADITKCLSFGINKRNEILTSEHPMCYLFSLSTIEALAEEQGMLWVEDEAIGEPTFSPLLSPDNNNGRRGRFIPIPPTTSQPSIEQLLIDCITLNNYIKRGERLFDFDEQYKLKLLQDSQSKLASKVAELNNILNPIPMQSVVEIAEEFYKF